MALQDGEYVPALRNGGRGCRVQHRATFHEMGDACPACEIARLRSELSGARAALACEEARPWEGRESLHEIRCLLMEDGWDSVGKPEDRLRVVVQRWQETRDGNQRLAVELSGAREWATGQAEKIAELTRERDAARGVLETIREAAVARIKEQDDHNRHWLSVWWLRDITRTALEGPDCRRMKGHMERCAVQAGAKFACDCGLSEARGLLPKEEGK